MATMTFQLSNPQVSVDVTITENADGTLTFDLAVTDDGTIGDLNGLFFDIADESLLHNLSVTGDDVTDYKIDANSVSKISSFTNMNGEVVKEYGKFDIGVQLGTQGMAKDDIQNTSFTLSSGNGGLTLDSFLSQDFAVRLTSVGETDGAREDSVKIGGTAPEEADPEDTPVNIANDDTMTVFEWETFNEPGEYDEVNDNGQTLLENDTTDEFIYSGLVTGVNDQVLTEGSYEGSNGGLLIVTAEGRVDFSAAGAFDGLEDGETGNTTFTYMIEGGDMALISVNVLGSSEPMDDFPGDDGLPEDDFIPDNEWVDPGFEIG